MMDKELLKLVRDQLEFCYMEDRKKGWENRELLLSIVLAVREILIQLEKD